MKLTQMIKTFFSSCIFLIATHTASAAPTALDLTCPSADNIHQFTSVGAFPYGFNNQTKRIKFFSAAAEPENMTSNMNGDWLLFIYPIEVQQSEQLQESMTSTIQKLLPYAAKPFQFSLIDDLQLPFCIYTSTDNNDINAIAYFVNNEYDDNDDFATTIKSKTIHHRLRMMNIAKHFKKILN